MQTHFRVHSHLCSAERIITGYANLFACLPKTRKATAYEQCWRKHWQDKEPHLLPAKHLATWIQPTYTYLSRMRRSTAKTQP